MKKWKFLAVVLSCIVTMPMFACGGGGGGGLAFDEDVDANRTQIYISHYNGGVGNSWYKPLKTRFEAAYADYVGVDTNGNPNGKTGVQLLISNHKREGSQEINSISDSTIDVYFSENFDYHEARNKGLLLDITDAVTSQNSDGKTIESKLGDGQKSFFKYGENYYGLPHYAYYGGLTYNVDVFENNFLYFAKNGGFIADLDDERSAGPNGVYGDFDDGLPATYNEFFELLDEMVNMNVIPFTWSGNYGKAYFRSLLTRLMATYEGVEQTMLNFTFEGTATHLVDRIESDGSVVLKEPTVISRNVNGGDIYDTAGRYYALLFGEKLLSNKNYYDYKNTNKSTDSHTDAQKRFVLSYKDPNKSPIAFLIDGTYWENEAYDVGAFRTLEQLYGVSRENTRFGFMPIPKIDETHIGEPDVLIENGGSILFINANVQRRCPEKITLLKEFIKFLNTDSSLVEFVLNTNSFKALNYDLTTEQENQLSYYTKQVLEARRQGEVLFPNDNNSKFLAKRSELSINLTFRTNQNEWALNALKDGTKAKDFFEQMSSYMKQQYSK